MKRLVLFLIMSMLALPCAAQVKQKRISKQQAIKAALLEVKGGKITSSELEKEEGKLVWSFDVKAGGKITEVWVDAYSGKVIKTEEESPAKEKSEKEEKKSDSKK